MSGPGPDPLTPPQLAAVQAALHRGSSEASRALAKWIGKPWVVEVDSVEQLPLEEATGLLAAGDETICFCSAEMSGSLSGELILAFDEVSGWALADLVLEQAVGATGVWTELTISAVLETANILCCAYLNSLARTFAARGDSSGLLPSPVKFSRDFAESLLQFALMGQAATSDQVLLARTRFEIDGTPVNWTLLFVPDAPSMRRLSELLPCAADEP